MRSCPRLVFPELVEGRYELYVKGTDQGELTAEVVGGEVDDRRVAPLELSCPGPRPR